jgi:hypothetical protein
VISNGSTIATRSLPNRWGFLHFVLSSRGANAAFRPQRRYQSRCPATRHVDRAANGVPGHDKRGQARPRSSSPRLIPCPTPWTVAKALPLPALVTPPSLGPTPSSPFDRLSQAAPRFRSTFAVHCVVRFASYGQVATPRQAERIRELGKPKSEEPDTRALERRLVMLEHRLPIAFELPDGPKINRISLQWYPRGTPPVEQRTSEYGQFKSHT